MCSISIVFLVNVLSLTSGQLQGVEQSGEKRLMADLMSTYDKRVRPIVNVSEAIVVTLNFLIKSISELDERKQELEVFGILELEWQDEYLQWDPADYNGTNAITFPPGHLWLPDIVLTSSARKMYDDSYYGRFHLVVRSTGLVRWVPAGHMTTSCKLNLEAYPFDVQKCKFEFDNWMYDGRHVALVNGSSEVILIVYSANGEWDITKTHLTGYIEEALNGVFYSRVIAEIQLTRKYTFYLVVIVAPSTLMCLLSVFVFCLPPDSGEKISLGVTVLLSFSVFSLLVADNLPKTSDHIPVLVTYLTAAMVLSAVSLMMSVFILKIHHHRARSSVPRWLRFIAFKIVGKIVLFQAQFTDKMCPEAKTDITCREDNDPSMMASEGVNGENNRLESDEFSKMSQILKHVKVMTQYLKHNKQDDVILEEWKTVAVIMDRFFCGLYAVGIMLMSAIVLNSRRASHEG